MKWEVVENGKTVRTGIVENLDVKPQETIILNLDLGNLCSSAEAFLNVEYLLKEKEGILNAGTVVARDQLVLNSIKLSAIDIKNDFKINVEEEIPIIDNADANYLIVSQGNWLLEFDKSTGYIVKYRVDGKEYLTEDAQLTPNFWRAPTDNDFGAGMQNKFAVWKNPELKLNSFKSNVENGIAVVSAEYELPKVQGKLYLTYSINNIGAIKVVEKLVAGNLEKVAPMFRFGLQMQMPEEFSVIEYYGRGPGENYADRNHSEFVGLYRQKVADQFYSYIRPQETGTKTDIRWWKQLNAGGNGLMFVSDAPFSASALNYTIESLDEGKVKRQMHSQEVKKVDFTNLCIDKVQMGLECIDSWGAWPLEKYLIPYKDMEFTLLIKPVKNMVD
jgi:Beta galactosidase small chain.